MKILLADDDESTRRGIETFLKREGTIVTSVENGTQALKKLAKDDFDILITDLEMPEMGGLELLDRLADLNNGIPVIVITAYATVENAVKAMQKGAEDFLTKPLNLLELNLKIKKLETKRTLIEENKNLKSLLKRFENPPIIGVSKGISMIRDLILKIASDPDVPVLIFGESGTGKEVIARNIHFTSSRREKPFVALNCAALPEELLESELFGYSKGAFTGALKDKPGLFQTADEGTLFLDEISEMSPRLQAKLLRVLQDHIIKPLGSIREVELNIRIITASNKNLKEMVEDQRFREDLFFRLSVIEITLPPLRERTEDIPHLFEHFLSEEDGKPVLTFSKEALSALQKYSWPGNIRELKNVLKMLEVMSRNKYIDKEDLPIKILDEIPTRNKNGKYTHIQNYQKAVDEVTSNFERAYLLHHLKKNDFNISKTADSIGLSRVTLHKKIKQYRLIDE